MSLRDITALFETAVAELTQVTPTMSFIHGSTELQNLLADGVEEYPCVFLDAPRTGEVIVRKMGAMQIGYNISYSVVTQTELDDSADNIRTVLQQMMGNALYLLSKFLKNFTLAEDVDVKWTEFEGIYDAHLTGVLFEFTIKESITNYMIC